MVVVLAVLTFAAVIMVVEVPKFLYKARVISYGSIVRKDGGVDASIPIVPVDSIFESDSLRFQEGAGAELKLEIQHDPANGYKTTEMVWKLEPESKKYGFLGPQRRKKVAAAKQALDSLAAVFSSHRAHVNSYLFLVDNTGGVNETMARLINARIEALRIPQALDKGDGLNASFGFISRSDYLQRCPDAAIELPVNWESSERETAMSEFNRCLKQVTAMSRDLPNSSVATGLFNQLGEEAGHKTYVLVFSDGIENNEGETVSFYKTPSLVTDTANWQSTAEKLQKALSVPNLNGVTIDWYSPPSPDAMLVRRSLDFWKWLLESKGARVTTHF
jgi:hypothetical protein